MRNIFIATLMLCFAAFVITSAMLVWHMTVSGQLLYTSSISEIYAARDVRATLYLASIGCAVGVLLSGLGIQLTSPTRT